MAKRITKRGLIKKLDTVFSQYIRTKYSKDGTVECYTCGKVKPIKEMHCGHFISRAVYSVRWEEDNCRPQCASCNLYHSGRQYDFGIKLEMEIGQGAFDILMEKRHQLSNFTQQDYIDMIKHYEELLNERTGD